MAPWSDIHYACDLAWWQRYYHEVQGLPSLKLTVDKASHRRFQGVELVGVNKASDDLELMKFGTVGWGGNSGFHAINLALQLLSGDGRIILVGMDMNLHHGVHWHGKHPAGMNNPTDRNVMRWRKAIDAAAVTIEAMGVRVINASPISSLENYPKMSLLEAMDA